MKKGKVSKDLFKLIMRIRKYEFNKKVREISIDYYDKSDEEKIILEIKLNDLINNIDKLSFASLFIFTIPPLLEAITRNDTRNTIIIAYFILYIVFGVIVISAVSLYRFYKMYLNIIENIKNKRIIFEINEKTVKEVSIIYKS